MIKKILFGAFAALLIASCQSLSPADIVNEKGVLDFSGFSLLRDDELDVNLSKASTPAPGNYSIKVYDTKGALVLSTSYSAVVSSENKLSLTAGEYVISASSSGEDVPVAAFEQPVYGGSKSVVIEAGKETTVGTIVCKLLQCKVTVSYDQDFLKSITGDSSASVEVTAGSPLEYKLTYNGGSPYFDQSAGYFSVNNGDNTTMTITFRGKIDGKNQKMTTAPFVGIKPAQWRQVKFIKKVDEEGNASFSVEIEGYLEDSELTSTVSLSLEDVIGDDPDAPKGDGGIKLEFDPTCTAYTDLQNIVVPKTGEMDLRLIATVPNGVKKFVVNIGSTNSSFLEAVQAAGGPNLDLVNPAEESLIIFEIVPFPHGQELLSQTEIKFNLSAAKDPLLAFAGTHTFKMMITDAKGCKKEIPVKLIVEE